MEYHGSSWNALELYGIPWRNQMTASWGYGKWEPQKSKIWAFETPKMRAQNDPKIKFLRAPKIKFLRASKSKCFRDVSGHHQIVTKSSPDHHHIITISSSYHHHIIAMSSPYHHHICLLCALMGSAACASAFWSVYHHHNIITISSPYLFTLCLDGVGGMRVSVLISNLVGAKTCRIVGKSFSAFNHSAIAPSLCLCLVAAARRPSPSSRAFYMSKFMIPPLMGSAGRAEPLNSYPLKL